MDLSQMLIFLQIKNVLFYSKINIFGKSLVKGPIITIN